MTGRPTRAFLLLAFMTAALVNPGNFGTIDTTRRLQVARWIDRGEPQVRGDDPTFGLIGKGGVRYAWYGIGQSLVLAPFDFAVSGVLRPMAGHFHLDDLRTEQLIELSIAFLMQSLLAFAALSLAFETLLLFQFSVRAATAGALSLLFGTTCLFYVQSAQENLLLLVMALAALYGVLRFRRDGAARWALLAGCACGLAILTRLPFLFDAAVFFGLAISLGCPWLQWSKGYLPPVIAAIAIDRWYQRQRFGSVFHTYMRELGEQLQHPLDAAGFPFSYPFWRGFSGSLLSPDKSIFLFDPLLVMLLAIVWWKHRDMKGPVRTALAWLAALLLAYILAYATYFDFGGDVAWAHRFLVTQVELLAMFAVPLLMTYAGGLSRPMRIAAWSLVCCAIALQAASTTLAPNVEVTQRERGIGHGVILDRAANLIEIARGGERGPRFAGVPPEWRTLYYLPFQLRFRFAVLSRFAIASWLGLLALLPFVVRRALR